MSMLDAAAGLSSAADPRHEAAKELESLVLKQVLASSGAFRGSEAAGSAVWSDLLAEAVAGAVGAQGGLGLSSLVEQGLPATNGPPPALVAGRAHVSSGFGDRVDPLDGTRRFHDGVDVAAPAGTPILAAGAGVVVSAGVRGGYGNAVELQHPDGTTTLYAHAQSLDVSPGQHVSAGEVIGEVGSTGRSTGPHLHFEVREGGHPVDPTAALQLYRRRAEERVADIPPRRVVP